MRIQHSCKNTGESKVNVVVAVASVLVFTELGFKYFCAKGKSVGDG